MKIKSYHRTVEDYALYIGVVVMLIILGFSVHNVLQVLHF